MTETLSHFRGAEGLLLAQETIKSLGEQSIPTSPANYEVWTTHRTGANPDLSREIDARLKRGDPFSDAANDELFDRFFANTRLSAQMVEAGEGIARELADVVSSLRGAGAQAGSYATELQAATQRMEGGLEPSDFRTIVARLAATTRDMALHNRQLEQRMQVSSRQVETLQSALRSVRVEALTDGLTGLANRKFFDETLRKKLGEEAANGAGLCLMMCDIDHFKRVNDTWGHPVGDQVIRFIAGVLNQHAQGDHLAARYGGEEFAIIMPRTALAAAQQLGAGVCQAVRAKQLARKSTGQVLGTVTISIGIARHRPSESTAALIARADACLYHSKRTGRDRVTTDADWENASAA